MGQREGQREGQRKGKRRKQAKSHMEGQSCGVEMSGCARRVRAPIRGLHDKEDDVGAAITRHRRRRWRRGRRWGWHRRRRGSSAGAGEAAVAWRSLRQCGRRVVMD